MMDSLFVKTLITLSIAAQLASCGGADTTSANGVSNDNPPALTVVQPTTLQQIGQLQAESEAVNGANGGDAEPGNSSLETMSFNDADSQTENVAESGDPSNSNAVDDDQSDQQVTSDNLSVIADATYPNSFCVDPGSTSVSYETFERSRTTAANQLFGGVHVPFPASGFGWDGTRVCDLEGSRELDVIEVLVPYVAQRPDTDGNIAAGEWRRAANAGTYNYETRGNDIDNLLLAPVPRYQDGAGYSEWWVMHDGTNLYIRIRVSNDSLRNVIIDSEFPWHDDSVELFIDGDNSKGESYDGINDYQVTLLPDNDTLPVFPGDIPQDLRIFHRAGGTTGTYDVEITVNLESAGIEIGKPFGFDLHINEDDNGGDRDAKWGWFEKSGFDRSWISPSRLGTLLLTDCEDRDQYASFQSLLP